METTPKQKMIFIVLGGVLLAAVAVGLVVFIFMRSPAAVVEVPGSKGDITLNTVSSTEFDLSLIERKEYKELDMSLFVRGLLPVLPPAGTGKTNIFR